MKLRRCVCRTAKFLRRITRLKSNKLFWIIIFLLFYIFYLIRTEKSEEIPLEISAGKNVSRKIISNTKYPPIVWWNTGSRIEDEVLQCSDNIKCHAFGPNHRLLPNTHGAYLFYASRLDFNDLPLPRNPEKVIWALNHEESPRNVVELSHEAGLQLFNFSSTFSRYSNVPFPLQYLKSLESITSRKYFVKTSEKNKLSNKIAPVIFMSSNCFTFTDRENYVKELMKYIPVDSYGTCLNNKQWPTEFPKDYLNNLDDPAILKFVARYKFAIAIENGVCEDYITEKFWRPIHLGVVPLYFGSPSIRDWFPNNKSAILINDFSTPKILSEYLYKLMENDDIYEEYLEHKINGIISNKRLYEEMELRPYQTDFMATKLEFECFVCKKLHENMKEPKTNIVTKSHYNCSKPISALTGQPTENEMSFWEYSQWHAVKLYKKVQSAL